MKVRSLFKTIPFLQFSFFLGMGIWFSRFFQNEHLTLLLVFSVLIFSLLLIVVGISGLSNRYRYRWIPGFCFFLLLLLTGVLLSVIGRPARLENGFNAKCVARVVEADITYSGYYAYTVEPIHLMTDHSVSDLKEMKWRIIVEPDDSLLMPLARPGFEVVFQSFISGHDKPSNPDVFDYGQYLLNQGVSGWGFVEKEHFDIVKEGILPGIRGYANKMRLETLEIYEKHGIKGHELQVLASLTLGQRAMLDDEIKNWFIHSGAVHVLAVSGLHAGIVFLFLNWFLSLFVPRKSSFRVIVVILVLVCYAILTGGAPSVFRAVVMLSVIQVGKYYKRSSNVYNLLGVSAFIILIVDPVSLYHVGFWLSHLAVAGIVTFYPVFRKYYAGGNTMVRGVGDLAAVSLAAQIGTFPLSLLTFRAFPSWFLLANFFILPLVAPILILAKFLILFSKFPFISLMLAGILNDLLSFMLDTVEWLNSLPYSYVKGLWVNEMSVWVAYTGLIAFMIWKHTKVRLFWGSTLVMILALMVSINVDYLRKVTTNMLVVFDIKRHGVIGMVQDGQGHLLINPEVTGRDIDFATSGFFAKNSFGSNQEYFTDYWNSNGQAICCRIGDACFLVLGDLDIAKLNVKRYSAFKGVIVLGDVTGDISGFLKRIRFDVLVLAKSCPPWCVSKWKEEVAETEKQVYLVAENGAFVFGDEEEAMRVEK